MDELKQFLASASKEEVKQLFIEMIKFEAQQAREGKRNHLAAIEKGLHAIITKH